MDDYIKILTDSSIIVNRVAFELQENDIETKIIDNVESGRLAGFGVQNNDVELYVLKSEALKAKNIIEGLENQ